MAMNTTGYHLYQNPSNPVHNTLLVTGSDKAWAQRYHAIKNITVHTVIDENGLSHADFDQALLPPYGDEHLRMNEHANAPNFRRWRFEVEADCENWFNTEIVNVVLAAWARFPRVLQTSHTRPLSNHNTIPEKIDMTFTTKIGNRRRPIAIGEMKRNLIAPGAWQRGTLRGSASQKKLSQELRGYVLAFGSGGVSEVLY